MNVLEQIEKHRIVPVIRLEKVSDAAPLADALCTGGLPVAEVTFRTEAAADSIRTMSQKYPHMLVGAGSLISVEQAKQAVDAGARFLVSAGFNPKVTEYAIAGGLPIFPGICTPTELMMLLEYNLPVAKFFPAEQYGGLAAIKALAAPFPQMRFMPTGGINAANILDYLAFEKIVACGGSWMVKDTLIRGGKFAEIKVLTEEAVKLVSKGE